MVADSVPSMLFNMLAVMWRRVVVASLELVGVENDEPTSPSFHLKFHHNPATLQHHLEARRSFLGAQLHRRL
jgi:hypothetical protein